MENRLDTLAPFDLDNVADYTAWREQKLDDYPTSIEQLIVEINDPRRLTGAEFEALHERCRKTNMAIYASPTGRPGQGDTQITGQAIRADRTGLQHGCR